MKLDQSILILIQVLLYMVSIATTICSYNFYNLCSSLLSYALFLYNFYSYNENNIQYNTYEGVSLSFPSYNSKLSYRIKDYNYFTFITLNAYNRQMRETLKICITIPKTFKRNYILPAITLMFHLLKFQNVFKMRAGAYPVVLHLRLLAMLLHHHQAYSYLFLAKAMLSNSSRNHSKQATRALTSHWARASACCPYTARGYPRANPKQPAGT
jgi:hypothetical protein